MQAESRQDKARLTLKSYIERLYSDYSDLIKIMKLESDDIASSDAERLSLHAELEAEKVKNIISLTRSIQTYREQITVDDNSMGQLEAISEMKDIAEQLGKQNIGALKDELSVIKLKLASIKLPKSARKVYYSGNNPVLMDIEI